MSKIIKGIGQISIGGKPIAGNFQQISFATPPPDTERISSPPNNTRRYWCYEYTAQISRKRLKRLLRKIPKQKKTRLPRKLKKRFRKLCISQLLMPLSKSSLLVYLKMNYRLKLKVYNLQRMPYSEGQKLTIRKPRHWGTTNSPFYTKKQKPKSE